YGRTVDPSAPGSDPALNPELAQTLRRAGGPGAWRDHGGSRGRGSARHAGGQHAAALRGGAGDAFGRQRRGTSRVAAVEVLDEHALLPAIYFVFSRAGCEAAVQQCLRSGLRLTTAEQASQIRRVVDARCAGLPPQDLDVLGFTAWSLGLERGIAAHHAGLLPLFKETVEDLFSQGLVKVVFATETLALGINMPARSVVLEALTKWDGSTHADLTAGEYTQLTGRAGRRGIDVEGHAVVVDHGALDPGALVGLASRRTYPLRSSFRPTYNMAVNLVAQVGRDRAREVLETSFAQFQADRGVVGLARQAQAHAEALEGYRSAMVCHLGDFADYAALRRSLSDREQDLSRSAARDRQAAAAASLTAIRIGDVVEISQGRRAGHAVVLDPGGASFGGPRPTVLTADRQVRTLSAADVSRGLRTVARVRIPPSFSPRAPRSRADLAASMRNALADPAARVAAPPQTDVVRSAAADDARVADVRRRLRRHPCHACPDREEHARWAERHHRLSREHDALLRRIEGRTSSIARVFDTVCEVLTQTGHLAVEPGEGGRTRVTPAGRTLRRLYAESDLLVARCLQSGAWDGLDPTELAAAVSSVVFEARREELATGRPVPGGPQGRLARALDATVREWSELTDLEARHGLTATRPLDLGLVEAVHGWASGRSLSSVLAGTDLAAGDFVRWCKQVIDLLDQVAQAAEQPGTRSTARRAVDRLRRGVVAYSSV
ncbi:MAG TPA: helicase-related protein, partial [Actinotalea sp.]|nr:helicase-related protein [Actinotalea sp.]